MMFVYRQDNPSKKRWAEERYLEQDYRYIFREEEGLYEVYHKNEPIGKESDYEGILDRVAIHKGA